MNTNTNSLKSQFLTESPRKGMWLKGTKKLITRFTVKELKEKDVDVPSGKNFCEQNKRSLSFMSPTISSESKDQRLEIESIQKLMQPKNCFNDRRSQ